jgi:hypothetical protein
VYFAPFFPPLLFKERGEENWKRGWVTHIWEIGQEWTRNYEF